MDGKELMKMFNKYPRIGALATANKAGDVNVAVFGSQQMIDENTVVMGIGENRTFHNLQRNSKAAFIVMEPGETVFDWKGARVYLEATDIETEGEFFDQIIKNIEKAAGRQAADAIHDAIRFKITEVRKLVDVS